MTYRHHFNLTPGILVDGASRRSTASANDDRHLARFVTQSHALGVPMANPRALFIAAAIAVALYLIGRRLSH